MRGPAFQSDCRFLEIPFLARQYNNVGITTPTEKQYLIDLIKTWQTYNIDTSNYIDISIEVSLNLMYFFNSFSVSKFSLVNLVSRCMPHTEGWTGRT